MLIGLAEVLIGLIDEASERSITSASLLAKLLVGKAPTFFKFLFVSQNVIYESYIGKSGEI